MKGKLMIALVILALVFGMVLVACDDGELPKIKEGDHETIFDIGYLGDIDPTAGTITDADGRFLNPKADTTKNKAPSLSDIE
jgi:hypothetical protein